MLNLSNWLDNLAKLEPNAAAGITGDKSEQAYLASIAMSLKRIADLMEYEQNEQNNKRNNDREQWNQG